MDDKDELEEIGRFALTFLTDAKKVWAILHTQYATSLAWQHVKKYSTTQNGHQVWRTLHTFFFGGDRVNTMYSDIISTLKMLFCVCVCVCETSGYGGCPVRASTAVTARTTTSTSTVLPTWSSTIDCPLSKNMESRTLTRK